MSDPDSDETSYLNSLNSSRRSRSRSPLRPISLDHLEINPIMTHQASAPVQIADLSLLKFRLNGIKPFDGNPEGLNAFIFSCKKVVSFYNVPGLSAPDFDIIILHLKTKLQDRATLQLSTRNYTTFQEFFDDLQQTFSLGKNLNSYRSDIMNSYKRSQQTLLEFAYEIRRLQDQACDFIQAQNYSAEETRTILKEIENISVEKVVSSCHHDLNRYFFGSQPQNLSTVISEIQRDLAFTQRATQNHSSPLYRHTPFTQSNRFSTPTPQRQISQPPYRSHQQIPQRPLPPRTVRHQPLQVNRNPNFNGSGRYANSNVFRQNQNPNQFNRNNYNNNNFQRPFQSYQRSQMYAPQRPFPNNFDNNFHNRNPMPPPRPTTQHPPTPMEVNNQEYYEPEYYDYYEDPYESYNYDDPYFSQTNNDPYYSQNYYDENPSNNEQFDLNEQEQNLNANNEIENFPNQASNKENT